MSQISGDPREVDRQALRAIFRDIEDGINDRQLGKILPHLDENAIVTYQNAEVTAGKQRITEYFERHLLGSHPLIKRFTIHGEISAPAVFYGDTAIAHGTTRDEMELAAGRKFKLDGKWSATIVRGKDVWHVACLHFSTNVLDNPVVNTIKKLCWITALVGLAAGALLVLVLR